MLSSSNLHLGEEKNVSEEHHCNTSFTKELNSPNPAASVSINNHKRNRQSYSEKERFQSESVSAQQTETCIFLSEKKSPLEDKPSEGIIIELKDNNISDKIDTHFDRCSVAKKPRDDINEMGDTGVKTSNVPLFSQAPSNQSCDKPPNPSIENQLSSEDSSSNKYIHEDYRLVIYHQLYWNESRVNFEF